MQAPAGDLHEEYRELFESAACGLLSTEANGTIRHVNKTLCTWLGYAPEELVQKKRLQELFTIGCKIFHQTHWLPLLQIQGSVAEVQLELVHRDGHVLPVLVNALRCEERGVVQHRIAVFVASDRRKYERELLAARKRAEELLESERAAQAALSKVLREQEQEAQLRAVLAEQLVGIVSHDLRTPLNAVLLGAHLLGGSKLSPAQARTVHRISSASKRASRLTADLLDFTQARLGGGLRITTSEIDLHAVVRECVEELRLAWPERRIEHCGAGTGAGRADPDRLAQVVTNLVNNALKYGAPEHSVTIRSSVGEAELSVDVHNRGVPIPEELLPRIFEVLHRGEQTAEAGSRSVGLGLYIVQQIATAHGGAVAVRSNADEGTTFTVRLPVPRAG